MSNEARAERLKAKLSNYKHQYPINVEWGDMDAMGHVNNSRYFYYGEASRLALLVSESQAKRSPNKLTSTRF